MKKVSVVMCTYNGADYLAPQLDSILQQTYPLHEILIQDDGSTDKTCRIIEDYQQRYPFIRLICNEKNLGYNRNFLSAIARADGDFIAISDQDDIWEPTKIEILIRTLDANPGQEACFCRSREFSDDPSIEPYWDPRRPNYGMERMIIGNMVSGHTLLMRRELAARCTEALYATTDGWYYDYFIVSMAAAYDTLTLCDQVLVHYRRHTGQVTATHDRAVIQRDGALRTMRKALRLYRTRKTEMVSFFDKKYRYFSDLPIRNNHLDNALKMARLFTRRDVVSYLRLTALCVKLRREIFYTADVPPVKLFFRSLVFPFYCAIYFQNKS